MTGARWGAALVCAAGLWFAIAAAQAAPDAAKEEAKASCLASPKGSPPAGEKWFYRVERGTKRHCWYTRAAGSRRVADAPPAPAAKAAPPKVSGPSLPEVPIQLDDSVANARAEANISATAAVAPPQPANEATPPNWQMAQRWSDHANGGAPFAPKPAAAPLSIEAPAPRDPQSAPAEANEIGTQHLLEIAGGAFGFAALATVLVMIFARRQQRRDATSTFALFAKTNDPKRRLTTRRAGDMPGDNIRPQLQVEAEEEIEPPMRAFNPRNMRMDQG